MSLVKPAPAEPGDATEKPMKVRRIVANIDPLGRLVNILVHL
ncbi:MAG: hypothetical protein ACREPV_13205 [Lysobacter sp.]